MVKREQSASLNLDRPKQQLLNKTPKHVPYYIYQVLLMFADNYNCSQVVNSTQSHCYVEVCSVSFFFVECGMWLLCIIYYYWNTASH